MSEVIQSNDQSPQESPNDQMHSEGESATNPTAHDAEAMQVYVENSGL